MRRCVAILAALVLALAGMGAYAMAHGFSSLGPETLHVAYPDYDEISNWGFMTAQYDALAKAGKRPELVLGSSELRSAPAGSAHPGRLFADGEFGPSALIAGRAGCNDLWQAIELGAFADRLPSDRKRAVVFTSMQWFMCYRNPAESFPGVFSQGAYDAFMRNGEIPSELKERVAARVRDYGVRPDVPADPLSGAISRIDRAASSLAADIRLGAKLHGAGTAGSSSSAEGLAGHGGAPKAKSGAPDWERIRSAAEAEVRASSTNRYGFSDTWFEKRFDGWLAGAQKSWRVEGDAHFSRQEFEDFELMLEVCRACGIEPLIVIQPIKGAAYDQTIYTREVRERYYDAIRSTCERFGVKVADFSDREYDLYFLRDYSHPSPVGSAHYSRALWDFWMDDAAAPRG